MRHILIADDEPHAIRVLKLYLERAGYHVETAQDGQAALAKLHARLPDVLITDIQMPRMSGEELCQQIEQDMPDRKFLIVVLTSRTELEHREWSRNASNLIFSEKPVSVRKLLARLDTYFSKSEHNSEQVS